MEDRTLGKYMREILNQRKYAAIAAEALEDASADLSRPRMNLGLQGVRFRRTQHWIQTAGRGTQCLLTPGPAFPRWWPVL